MKLLIFRRRILVIMLLILPLIASWPQASAAEPQTQSIEINFEVGPEGTPPYAFSQLAGNAGCALAQIKDWSSTDGNEKATRLHLALKGPDGQESVIEGSASLDLPLWVSHDIDESEANRNWTIEISNPTGTGTARGKLELGYLPAEVPCEFEARYDAPAVVFSWNWRHPHLDDHFLVERKEGKYEWSSVQGCELLAEPGRIEYTCTDTNLESGKAYIYQLCAINHSGDRCGSPGLTPARSVEVVSSEG